MKLTVLSGLPASGKSTMAKFLIQKNPNYVRINRDLLREMLHFNTYNEENERMTRELAQFGAMHLLLSGRDVIIDDTNLSEKHEKAWREFAAKLQRDSGSDEFTCEVDVIKMDTSYFECLRRNRERANPVPQDVIVQLAMRYQMDVPPEKGYVICDLDGTIADCRHRLHFIQPTEGRKKDYDKFYDAMNLDMPLEEGIAALSRLHQDGYEVIYMTGRPERYRGITRLWLIEHIQNPFGITDKTILMRKDGDHRPDTEVKKELLDSYFTRDKGRIRAVIEDRPRVAEMFRAEGLEVIEIGSTEEVTD